MQCIKEFIEFVSSIIVIITFSMLLISNFRRNKYRNIENLKKLEGILNNFNINYKNTLQKNGFDYQQIGESELQAIYDKLKFDPGLQDKLLGIYSDAKEYLDIKEEIKLFNESNIFGLSLFS